MKVLDPKRLKVSVIENQDIIEESWDKTFGNRKIEIVFIGQNMKEAEIRANLDACLATDQELESQKWLEGYPVEWPMDRTYALE